MITNNQLFNKETINIFTDASITKYHAETIGCPGVNIVNGYSSKDVIFQDYKFIRHTTSNNAEIRAVMMGVNEAVRYRNMGYRYINLFSDSKICIFGLREWINKWVANSRGYDYLISSSNKPVANQEEFRSIINTIIENNLHINFYHQNGHINTRITKSVLEAKKTFKISNNIYDDIEPQLIVNISNANNEVDLFTKKALDDYLYEPMDKPDKLFKMQYKEIDINKYNKLIRGEN